jgi:hypothetical protein
VLGRQRNRAAGAPPQARAVGERGPGGVLETGEEEAGSDEKNLSRRRHCQTHGGRW